jgi:hypothetical protein
MVEVGAQHARSTACEPFTGIGLYAVMLVAIRIHQNYEIGYGRSKKSN